MTIRSYLLIIIVSVSLLAWSSPVAFSEDSCNYVVHSLNSRLHPRIDEQELVEILRTLNANGNTSLPRQYVTKKRAKRLGWRPGSDLWSIPSLEGKSIGGDLFQNRDGRLLAREEWHEADLGYRGGHRGGKRLIYSTSGLRMVTVDHYRSFTEVPQCR